MGDTTGSDDKCDVLFDFDLVQLHLHSCAWTCLYNIQMHTKFIVLNSTSELKEPFAVLTNMEQSINEVEYEVHLNIKSLCDFIWHSSDAK